MLVFFMLSSFLIQHFEGKPIENESKLLSVGYKQTVLAFELV